MQAIFDFLAGIVIALTAAAFAQFGVTLSPKEEPRPAPEARRTHDQAPADKPEAVTVQSRSEPAQGVDSPRSDVDKSVHRGA